jgi:L-histidine N-alpha-methyltransferase
MTAAGHLRRFAPFDVDEVTLRNAAKAVAAEYGDIDVHAIVGDFEHHLDRIPGGGRRVIAFLGGTIGNLHPEQRATFLGELAAGMQPGDALLLGTDLVKDIDRLEGAYDDRAGVTAEFNRNILRVVNRELDADFRLDRFEHRAFFDAERSWIEMRLRSLDDVVVRVPGAGIEVAFDAGEEIRTEISTKFTPERVEQDLRAADLALEDFWTDDGGQFGLSLASPA